MAGAALGLFSRAIDTASWAEPWFGLILLPWWVWGWLAGAWLARPDGSLGWGAAAGIVLLAATVAGYLVAAGDAPPSLAGRLVLLALISGPLFGASGAAVHRGLGGRLVAILGLVAGALVQGVLLVTIGS
ncbi:MAG TPA: hypothetical protein VFY43_07865 [Candidatus Limnocylindria bacterium]|nr:hypothetical protein [Candidatus Limnocylindria bacterium]